MLAQTAGELWDVEEQEGGRGMRGGYREEALVVVDTEGRSWIARGGRTARAHTHEGGARRCSHKKQKTRYSSVCSMAHCRQFCNNASFDQSRSHFVVVCCAIESCSNCFEESYAFAIRCRDTIRSYEYKSYQRPPALIRLIRKPV